MGLLLHGPDECEAHICTVTTHPHPVSAKTESRFDRELGWKWCLCDLPEAAQLLSAGSGIWTWRASGEVDNEKEKREDTGDSHT